MTAPARDSFDLREWRGLDILIANAAATSFRAMHKAERRHLERTYSISVFG